MRVICITVLALAVPATAGPDVTYSRSYFKESVPLTLDTSRLAVRHASQAGADALAGRLGAVGIASGDVRPWTAAGWSMAELPKTLRDDDAVRLVADTLPDAPEIDFASPVFLDDDGNALVVTPDLLVGFAPGTTAAAAKSVLRDARVGRVVEKGFGGMPGVYRLRSSRRSGIDVLADANVLAMRPEVRFAEPDMIQTGRLAEVIADDPDFFRCWGVHNTGQDIREGIGGGPDAGVFDFDMDGPEAWAITRGDPSIVVVVFDNGIELDHPDLNAGYGADFANVLQAKDQIPGAPRVECDNHGTAVGGTIAGRSGNGMGVVGIAPGCTVAAARVFNMVVPEGQCTSFIVVQSSWIVEGLDWALSNGARVTNHSYSIGASSAITAKFEQTYDAGMMHFAAAGNSGNQGIGYPGSLDVVSSIAAADHEIGGLASFSSFGPGLEFTAPGHRIATVDRTGGEGYAPGPNTGPEDGWAIVSGTSFASPYSAGVAALILSIDPHLTPGQVRQIMRDTTTDMLTPGYDDLTGWGLLNARSALELATEYVRGDVTNDEKIDVDDIVEVITHWGTCHDPVITCDGDATADSIVDEYDLLEVLLNWE